MVKIRYRFNCTVRHGKRKIEVHNAKTGNGKAGNKEQNHEGILGALQNNEY